MGVWVRERPPTSLSVTVTPPGGGPSYLWNSQDKNVNNVPNGMTFATAMPGGFSTMTCTLERDPRRNWPDLQELSQVTVYGLGGSAVAFQGRLEDLPDTGGSQAQVTPTISGYQSALDDNSSAAMIYVDRDLSTWEGAPLADQITIAAANRSLQSFQIGADPDTDLPALVLSIQGPSTGVPISNAWYDSGDAGPIAQIYYDLTALSTVVTGSFEEQVAVSKDAGYVTSEASSNLNSSIPVAGYFIPSTPYRYGVISFYWTGGLPFNNNGQFNTNWLLAVYGDHGLTGYGTDPVGFLASDICAHAVSTWAPEISFSTGSSGSIQPSAYIIPQIAFTTPTTVSAIIKQAVQYELLDWAVWEQTAGTTGPTMYVNARGARGNAWVTRVGQCQLQETGAQASRIYNGVVVQWSGVDGNTYTSGPPGSTSNYTSSLLLDSDPQNPANEAGIDRWGLLQMGTTTAAGALQVGSQWLQTQAELDTSGQASIVGHIQDTTGAWWPAWMIRAGDSLAVVDAKDPSPRRVVSTSYDDTSVTNSVQLDVPPDQLDALLQRMSEAIAAIGLT